MPKFDFIRTFHPINARRGEVCVKINGRRHILRLSLTALACLENFYGGENILSLTRRFAKDGLGAQDVHHILSAGLIGGGYMCSDKQAEMQINVEGGFETAAHAAAQLLERAFVNH